MRLLVALGHAWRDGSLRSLKRVAEADDLPLAYLEAIAARLRRAGLVEATRGAQGGYRLTRDPASITMDEAIVALEGAVAPVGCLGDQAQIPARLHCSHTTAESGPCATKYLWTRVQGGVVHVLQETTLADLVAFSAGPDLDGAPMAPPSLVKELHA